MHQPNTFSFTLRQFILACCYMYMSIAIAACGSNANNEDQNNQALAAAPDICRCLTEPGNTDWAVENRDACRDTISKELGVENWETVNFSKEPALNEKWDQLQEKCTGSTEVKTGIESIDKNSNLTREIGTAYGYIWEALNPEADIYTTLAFDGLIFRSTAYTMNGETNSENFTKMIDLSGKWTAIDALTAEGVIEQNNVPVSWTFSEDYSTLTNSKGVVFKRVKVK